jgi:phosphoenolpyruvate-protein phosphotransferase (PTS system enzyme I)
VGAAAQKEQISVSICGQMSSDPLFVPLLIGMGFRQLSVTPQAISELKEVIRNLTVAKAEQISTRVETMETARDVEAFLRGELKKICPESVQ